MIYVLEVPHQRPAQCWSAGDQDEVIARITRSLSGTSHSWLREGGNVEFFDGAELVTKPADQAPSEWDYWTTANGDDLSSQIIFESADEALQYLATPGMQVVHQNIAAGSALRREMESNDEGFARWVVEGDEEDFTDATVLERRFTSHAEAEAAATAAAAEPEEELWSVSRVCWYDGWEADYWDDFARTNERVAAEPADDDDFTP